MTARLVLLCTLPLLPVAPTAPLPAPSAVAPAAPTTSQDATLEAAKTIDGLVAALYQAVSFDPGGRPDFDVIRNLCLKGCTFVLPPRRGAAPEAISTEDFIALFESDYERGQMAKTGFHEHVAHHQAQVWRNTASVAVVFEARFDPAAEQPLARGLDRIHLVRQGGGWRIASIVTEFERPGSPLPPELLGKAERKGAESASERG